MFQSTSKQWRSVFFISAEIYVFGVIIYSLLASGVVQPWAIHNEYQQVPAGDGDEDDDTNSVNYPTTDQ